MFCPSIIDGFCVMVPTANKPYPFVHYTRLCAALGCVPMVTGPLAINNRPSTPVSFTFSASITGQVRNS